MFPVVAEIPGRTKQQHNGDADGGIEFVEVGGPVVPGFTQREPDPDEAVAPDQRAGEGVDHER